MITYFGVDDDLQSMGLCTGDDAFMGSRASRRARRAASRPKRQAILKKIGMSLLPGGRYIVAAQLAAKALKKLRLQREQERLQREQVRASAKRDFPGSRVEQSQIERVDEPEPVSIVPEAVEQVIEQEPGQQEQEQEPEQEQEQEAEEQGIAGEMPIPLVIGAAALVLFLLSKKR